MRNLLVTAMVLVAAALLPTSITGWITALRGPFMTLIGPVSGPASLIGGWLRPEERLAHPDATTPESELLERVDELTRQYFTLVDQLEEANALVRDLQQGVDFQSEVPIARVEASRVGHNLASGTIDVSRGSRDGVVPGTVAVARRSQQLIGVVSSVGPMVSTVHLITDTRMAPGLVVGVVMPREITSASIDLRSLPRVHLKPADDGTLVAEAVGVGDAQRIAVGQRVRLLDETWPPAASMLVLGQVVRIDPTEEPLFRRIVVRPEVDPPTVRAMILHIPREPSDGGPR